MSHMIVTQAYFAEHPGPRLDCATCSKDLRDNDEPHADDCPGKGTEQGEAGTFVDLIASGYEWTCPVCDTYNTAIGVKEAMHDRDKQTLKCKGCRRIFVMGELNHAYG